MEKLMKAIGIKSCKYEFWLIANGEWGREDALARVEAFTP